MGEHCQIAIVIPTFNRADALDYSLEVHIPILREYGIGLHVFDNSSTDDTEQIVSKWMREYQYLSYYKNETNIGAVANVERALRHPNTDYVWMIGDTYQLPYEAIGYLFERFKNSSYDAVVFNLADKLVLPAGDYHDPNLLLRDLGAVATCLSCVVFSRELLGRADFEKYRGTYFPHTGILFEDAARKDSVVHWAQPVSVSVFKETNYVKSNWSKTDQIWEVACETWISVIMTLPAVYTMESRTACLKEFGKVSGHFTLGGLVSLRMNGLLNLSIANRYRSSFGLTIDYPWWFILMIASLPLFIIKLLYSLRQILR